MASSSVAGVVCAQWAARRGGRIALAAVMLVASAASSTTAFAQAAPAPNQAQADALFAEGRDLLEKGRFADACAKLASSEELSPAVGTLLNLGYCYEQVGKLRSAMDAYAEAQVLASTVGEAKRASFAKERFAAVEPRAPRLVLRVVPPEPQGIEIKRNGVAVPKTDLDHPIPVDPQDYVVTASAPGYATWKGAIIVRGEGAVVTMIIPPLDDAANVAPSATTREAPSPITGRRVMALGLGAVSALALGGGIAAAFSAKSRYDDANSHCDDSGCDAAGTAIQHGAVTEGNIATALIGFGALCGAAGIYLWIVGAPDEKPSRARADVGVQLNARGAALGGHF